MRNANPLLLRPNLKPGSDVGYTPQSKTWANKLGHSDTT
jgi:hypothetical protein